MHNNNDSNNNNNNNNSEYHFRNIALYDLKSKEVVARSSERFSVISTVEF